MRIDAPIRDYARNFRPGSDHGRRHASQLRPTTGGVVHRGAAKRPGRRSHAMMARLVLPLPDLEATRELGRRLARLIRRGDVIALRGVLGSGKTELARALLRA